MSYVIPGDRLLDSDRSRIPVLGATPRGIYRFGANPEGQGKTGDPQAARPSVLAPGSALRFRPRIALSSAQAIKQHTTSWSLQQRLPIAYAV